MKNNINSSGTIIRDLLNNSNTINREKYQLKICDLTNQLMIKNNLLKLPQKHKETVLNEIYLNLYRIGGNLNQLIHLANRGQIIKISDDKLDQLMNQFNKLYPLIKEMIHNGN